MRATFSTAPAFLICSGLSVSGRIKPFTLALVPETEAVKHRDYSKPQPKDLLYGNAANHDVGLQGLEAIIEDCPGMNIYLGRQGNSEKPVPFWHVEPADDEDDANMRLIGVTVEVRVSAGILGDLKTQSAGIILDSYINPEAVVKVTLPVFVNTRLLKFGEKLTFYKKAEAAEEKKRKGVEEIDSIADWAKQRAEERKKKMKKEDRLTGPPRARP
jgi:hypothetical protein